MRVPVVRMPESSSRRRSMTSRIRLYAFVVLLACLTSCSIVCFSLAIMDAVFVYAGIFCLMGVVLLIAAHFIYRRCSSSSSSSSRGRRRSDGRVAQVAPAATVAGSRDLRALERDVADLMGEVSRVQATALCSLDAVVRLRDDVETESGRLALWIEGVKVPEPSEVQDLVERLDDIRIEIQSIRRRSDRIGSALEVHRPFVSTLSYSDHLSLPPPPYEDAQRHLSNERHTTNNASTSFALSASALPSYSSSSSSQLTPSSAPSVDDYAPPPYEEAAAAPH